MIFLFCFKNKIFYFFEDIVIFILQKMIFLLLRIKLFVAAGKWKFFFRQRLKILPVKISFHGDNYKGETNDGIFIFK